ncbi:hypothetical protein BDV25DRAFT_170869 [Aspergillus avenaceus]|uniref:Prolyl 4-hydroxylase alpha subunit domain-containing protein n=1 Tax=Aspergillus avenaceus TaxID=36643 RepID=A0A5N6TG24_ASPAV|nr:hypothetical protein BDV25DRAFT_170869 [Aspergillus avenaceus]
MSSTKVKELPPGFLLEASPSASLRKIDFTTTTPAIPAYKDFFAAVIDNFMTESECQQLLHLAEATTDQHTPKWERAMVNAGNGKQDMAVGTRNCGRIIWDSTEIAERLLNRLKPFLAECDLVEIVNRPQVTGAGPAKRGDVYRVSGLNEKMRFLRYEGGEYFRPHWDGTYVAGNGERSIYTIHLYLNGDGEQDVQELEREIEKKEREQWLHVEEDGEIDLWEVGGDGGEEGEEDVREGLSAVTDEAEERLHLLGGATSFTEGIDSRDAVRVFPKAGSVLIFQQRNLFHGGDDVFRGVKYTMRTDVMYSKV